MLHNTLSALLVSVASRYAKLSPSDVGIGIGGGHLVIDDVQLRADALNGPHTPFEIRHGRAGRLRVNVPWGALTSSPVQVYLENVHLIASPKEHHHASPPPPPQSTTVTATAKTQKSSNKEWYQTNVGRLLFNVSVEIFGLKVEYRDVDCIGILSIASLQAFSAGPDWSMQFASLVSDLDCDQPDASAVAMRKSVKLTGVHFVMIPRLKPKQSQPSSYPVTPSSTGADTTKCSPPLEPQTSLDDPQQSDEVPEGDHQQRHLKLALDRNLDLSSFESENPILDGVSIALRVLLCTGATVLPEENTLTPGMHGEVFVEIDEPSVKLTARQLTWLQHILRQALGDDDDQNCTNITISTATNINSATATSTTTTATTTTTPTDHTNSNHTNLADASVTVEDEQLDDAPDAAKRRPRSASAPNIENTNGSPNSVLDVEGNTQTQNRQTSASTPEVASAKLAPKKKPSGGFRSVWEAIVGENSDETVDDAAIALGLWTESRLKSKHKTKSSLSSSNGDAPSSKARNGDGYDSEYEEQDDGGEGEGDLDGQSGDIHHDTSDEEEVEDDDMKYARRAVANAAACGGVSWHVRLRTSDTKAWDKIRDLEKELADMSEKAKQLERIEQLHRETEAKHLDVVQNRDILAERNQALATELSELEQMTARAARNKDEVIHQLQSALSQAQRNLQAFHDQQQLQRQQAMYNAAVMSTPSNVIPEDQLPPPPPSMYPPESSTAPPPPTFSPASQPLDGPVPPPPTEPPPYLPPAASDPAAAAPIPEPEQQGSAALPPPGQSHSQSAAHSSSTAPPSLPAPTPDSVPAPVSVPVPSTYIASTASSTSTPPDAVPDSVDTAQPDPQNQPGADAYDPEDTNDPSETGTVVEHEDAEVEDVPVLADDTGGLLKSDDPAQPVPAEVLPKATFPDDVDVVQHASLQSFYNDDNDINKLEQRMGVQGLTLI